MSSFLWKPHIIRLTEGPAARARKCDASFFPPVSEETLADWESENSIPLHWEIRSYLTQSDGLEAQRGEIWPVLPLAQWIVIEDECVAPSPWIRFGETENFFYLLGTDSGSSIYRSAKFGSVAEFFSASFKNYLELIFRGEG